MSDMMRFKVSYETPLNKGNLDTLAMSLAQGIEENWATFHEPWGMELSDYPKKLTDWFENLSLDQMEAADPEEVIGDDDIESYSNDFGFLFSPTSSWIGYISVEKTRGEKFGISFYVDADMRYLDYEFSGYYNVEFLWNINKCCLLNIYEKSKNALPVRSALIDEEMLTVMP